MIRSIFDSAVGSLRELLPDLGESLAIDGTEVSSWCNCHAKDKSDKDAGWGIKTHRNDDGTENKHMWYGYTVEFAVDTKYELPVNFEVLPANPTSPVRASEPRSSLTTPLRTTSCSLTRFSPQTSPTMFPHQFQSAKRAAEHARLPTMGVRLLGSEIPGPVACSETRRSLARLH